LGLLPALGDFYERERRWSDAAAVYERAVQRTRNAELRARYASGRVIGAFRARVAC